MSKYGLRKNPTFESLLDTGNEYDFSNVTVYNRAALNFRQGFFGPSEPIEGLVDNEHDDKHEAILARMRGAAAEFDRQAEQARERARNAYREQAVHNPNSKLSFPCFSYFSWGCLYFSWFLLEFTWFS